MVSEVGLADDEVKTKMAEVTTKTSGIATSDQAVVCPICGGRKAALLLEAPDHFHLRTEKYSLVRCASCSAVWQINPPQPAEMGKHYTEEYHRAIVTAGEGSAAERWKPQVELISSMKKGGAILDLGCSSGGFLSTMRGPAWELYGIEMEESTADKARANTGAKVFVGDAVLAPYAPNSFDVITCFDVLEHVYSPRQFLTKVKEWLKPGGIYYAMMPNIGSWEARVFGTRWFGLEMPRHLFHFSRRSLRYLLNDLGFEEVVVKTPAISYIERSAGYVASGVMEKMGFTPTAQATPQPLGFPEKVVRKGFRVAAIRPFAHVASWADAGPSLEVVFRKPQH